MLEGWREKTTSRPPHMEGNGRKGNGGKERKEGKEGTEGDLTF